MRRATTSGYVEQMHAGTRLHRPLIVGTGVLVVCVPRPFGRRSGVDRHDHDVSNIKVTTSAGTVEDGRQTGCTPSRTAADGAGSLHLAEAPDQERRPAKM
ncbi:hypothetical protein [Dietzia sp. 179-F 9C3 NHS]|uniref:hypothetical protein n=1 Tax=Dietzia sp. 179-F 9C3 NHS TaxID=3374295 RepID=UPI003879B4FD